MGKRWVERNFGMGDDSEACAVVDGGFLYEMEFCGEGVV